MPSVTALLFSNPIQTPSSRMTKTVIVGAGLSGLIAARELRRAGQEVLIVEKSARVGGRMATQEVSGRVFDSGAQFFTARSEEFKTALQEWIKRGIVREWFQGDPSLHDKKLHDAYPRFCGARGMSSVPEFLARDLDIHFQTTIVALDFHNQIWTAKTAAGREYSSDFLLLTAPLPQSLALFDSSGRVLPAPTRAALESVHYEPCLAVLATLKNALRLFSTGALHVNIEPIAWLADNFSKGISHAAGAMTIHSTAKFAQENFSTDEKRLAEKLLSAAQEYCDAPLEVEDFQVRRWYFSKPQNALDEGAVFIPHLNLGFAGDGLCGAKIEGAFRSGLQAACTLRSKLSL